MAPETEEPDANSVFEDTGDVMGEDLNVDFGSNGDDSEQPT